MYVMENIYSCDICGFEGVWDITDDVHGTLWGCEKCGATFCTKCFVDKMGQKTYWDMMRNNDLILCPECYSQEKIYDAKMIDYIRDAIMYGLDKDFWSEDSCLVEGCHECQGEQLDCEGFSIWKDDINGTILHLSLGAGKQYKITIEEEIA